MIRISFIVPVYNVELYLRKCIDSILSQSYQEIEIILVDDGSTDNSSEICDEYLSIDSRITVIHKPNGGLSDARNRGVDVAMGDYVMFVDSDDFLANESVVEMLIKELDTSESPYDFVNFNCVYYYQKSNVYKPWPLYPASVINSMDKNETVVNLISLGLFPMSACLKIIRKDFLVENHIRFQKGITSEDIPWFLNIILASKKYKFINGYYYIYRKQVAGTISSSFSSKKYSDLFLIVQNELNVLQSKNIDPLFREAILSFLAYEYCIILGLVNNFNLQQREQHLKALKQYEWLLQYDLNPKVRMVKRCLKIFGSYLTRSILLLYINKIVNRN